MKTVILLLAVVVLGWGDERGLSPLTRGVFQNWVGSESRGTFTFETLDKKAWACDFTSRTYFEREHKRTYITAIDEGQQVEVLSERTAEPPRCRALIVRVLTPKVLESPRYKPLEARRIVAATETFAPRGNIVLAGVITHVDERSFELRTREGKRHSILFRSDTKLARGGVMVEGRGEIPLNKPLQVRAGRTFENFVEAYSIFWGDILQPGQGR